MPIIRRYSTILASNNPAHTVPSVSTLLKACKTCRQLQQVHSQIIRKGLEQDHFLITQFICLSRALSCLFYSTSVFNRVLCPNIFLWNALIRGYCEKSSFSDTVSVFIRMKREEGSPDSYTFPSLIKACTGEDKIREGKAIHGSVVRHGVEGDVFVSTSLVDLYGKCREIECARKVFNGDMVSARFLFDQSPDTDIVAWSALITGYTQNGQPTEALNVFLEMNEMNIKPDEFIIVSLMAACSQIGLLVIKVEHVPAS
ncbi:hypothetical protein FEM48_Zijuj12G0066500 [Ziziphus jujuba var. spinosa]|uniref:Pentatricopeptide repeat-containing protein n=1 Tax=Ziziphus jujuba var. spinosa TaxID=714518 RepID=A0A978UBR8_ZIZJJ|nr:hypothetical protein FEM48_Zijuj12G0066500 [Ziziphus jujuba var. spinosa]